MMSLAEKFENLGLDKADCSHEQRFPYKTVPICTEVSMSFGFSKTNFIFIKY